MCLCRHPTDVRFQTFILYVYIYTVYVYLSLREQLWICDDDGLMTTAVFACLTHLCVIYYICIYIARYICINTCSIWIRRHNICIRAFAIYE